jgi:ectoine hydroxylase-related dioxygenase (phytanoyl-CoA dioxygenase family)
MTNQEINFFYDNGFIVIKDIFSEQEVALLKKVADEELAIYKNTRDLDWPLHKLEAAKNKCVLQLAKDPRIVNRIKPLLGYNIQLQHSKFAVKPPGKNNGTVHWHQDFAFFPHTNDDLVAVSIALCDITHENGGMVMMRGSHKHGLLNHHNADGTFAEQCLNEAILQDSSLSETLFMPSGSIAFHHCLTVHCSRDNLSDESRLMIVFEYRSSDAYQLADGIWADTGIQISGQPSDHIRLGGRYLTRNNLGDLALHYLKAIDMAVSILMVTLTISVVFWLLIYLHLIMLID